MVYMKNYFNSYGGISGIIDRFTAIGLIYTTIRVMKKATNGQSCHATIVFSMATLARFGQNSFMYSPNYQVVMQGSANNDNDAIKVINLIILTHWKAYGRCTFT